MTIHSTETDENLCPLCGGTGLRWERERSRVIRGCWVKWQTFCPACGGTGERQPHEDTAEIGDPMSTGTPHVADPAFGHPMKPGKPHERNKDS